MPGWLRIVIEFLVGLFKAMGREEVIQQQKEKTDALEEHYREIDAGPVDPHAALDRLRNNPDRDRR